MILIITKTITFANKIMKIKKQVNNKAYENDEYNINNNNNKI